MRERVARILPVLLTVCFLLVPSVSAYTDDPPADAPFTGSLYLSLDTRELGPVTVYLPVTYRSGYLSYSNGNLFNVSNSTVSGVMYYGGTEYQFRLSSWSTPQYRLYDSGYTYSDLTVTAIEASNAVIAEEFPPLVSGEQVVQWIPVLLMGVIVLCLFMKRF